MNSLGMFENVLEWVESSYICTFPNIYICTRRVSVLDSLARSLTVQDNQDSSPKLNLLMGKIHTVFLHPACEDTDSGDSIEINLMLCDHAAESTGFNRSFVLDDNALSNEWMNVVVLLRILCKLNTLNRGPAFVEEPFFSRSTTALGRSDEIMRLDMSIYSGWISTHQIVGAIQIIINHLVPPLPTWIMHRLGPFSISHVQRS